MKILLLEHPRSISTERCNDIANAPLSSCLLSGYIASILKSKGHDVEIIEGYLEKLTYEQIFESIKAVKPDILGVHMVYHWKNDHKLFDMLENLKNQGITSYITTYGYYPNFAYEEILKSCPSIDSIILGEPELTFAELVESYSNGNSHNNVKGILYQKNSGEICYEKRELIVNLDDLPFPERTEASYSIGEVNILGSRGCYGGCTFCYINPFYGSKNRWRGRSPENIIDEIDEIIEKTNMRYFYFTDPNFFGPGKMGQERAKHLATLLKSRNIEFGIEARVDSIFDDSIEALVEAGLRHLLIGLESGKDESLKRLNKMTTVSQNEQALIILRKHGIEPNIGFIMFEPDSTVEDLRINFDFLKRNLILEKLEVTVNVLYHHQIILQGTKSYKILNEQGRLQLSQHSTYEASTNYINTQVSMMAQIMRDITNHLFNYMEGIWNGRIEKPRDIEERNSILNKFLVEKFDSILKILESGKYIDDEMSKSIVDNSIKYIDEIIVG